MPLSCHHHQLMLLPRAHMSVAGWGCIHSLDWDIGLARLTFESKFKMNVPGVDCFNKKSPIVPLSKKQTLELG